MDKIAVKFRDPPVCDFCSSKEVTHIHPCPDFTIAHFPFSYGSNGGFLSCEECSKLVDAGDRDVLLERSVKLFFVNYSEFGDVPEEFIRMCVRKLHGEFWKFREKYC